MDNFKEKVFFFFWKICINHLVKESKLTFCVWGILFFFERERERGSNQSTKYLVLFKFNDKNIINSVRNVLVRSFLRFEEFLVFFCCCWDVVFVHWQKYIYTKKNNKIRNLWLVDRSSRIELNWIVFIRYSLLIYLIVCVCVCATQRERVRLFLV